MFWIALTYQIMGKLECIQQRQIIDLATSINSFKIYAFNKIDGL